MEPPKPRILCTEDDPDTRELIGLTLQYAGFEVDCVDSADDAVRLAQTEAFDLYLLDNWMPRLSGVGLCEKLREFDMKTPILFYSAAAFETDIKRAFTAGAQGYVTKPANGDVLIGKVQELLSEAHSLAKFEGANFRQQSLN